MVKNAFIAPYCDWAKSVGCIIDENGQTVTDPDDSSWIENARYYNLNNAKHEMTKVIYLGFLLLAFGHSFTDNLRKLWFFDTRIGKLLLEEGWGIVYTTESNAPLPGQVKEMMLLAGFDISKARHIKSVTGFEEICIPDSSFIDTDQGRKYSKEYEYAIHSIMTKVPKEDRNFGKIYFSRSKFVHNNYVNKEYGEKR